MMICRSSQWLALAAFSALVAMSQSADAQNLPGGAPAANAQLAAQAPAPVTTNQAEATVVEQLRSLPVSSILRGQGPGHFHFDMPAGRSRCGHVMHMLMRNLMHEQMFGGAPVRRPHSAPVVVADAFGRPVLLGRRMGDLELVSVQMVSDAADDCGPLYTISIHNDSEVEVTDFRVSLVAVLGAIHPSSPTMTVNVDSIEAGETIALQVQLPLDVMAIDVQGAAAAAFDTLVVAIDSFDELLEADELNNIAVLRRGEIALIVTEEAAVGETTAPAAIGAPSPAESVGPSAEQDAAPNTAPSLTPQDKLDFDQLDFGDAEESAIRIGG